MSEKRKKILTDQELSEDANLLMDAELMETFIGGKCEQSCSKGCSSQCKHACATSSKTNIQGPLLEGEGEMEEEIPEGPQAP